MSITNDLEISHWTSLRGDTLYIKRQSHVKNNLGQNTSTYTLQSRWNVFIYLHICNIQTFFFQRKIMGSAIIFFICILSLTIAISSSVGQYSTVQSYPKVQGTGGVSAPMCSMFGCDCVPPSGARCCTGYRYDPRSQKCRKVIRQSWKRENQRFELMKHNNYYITILSLFCTVCLLHTSVLLLYW